MSLSLCTNCGHPWVYHEDDGCTELVETDTWDGVDACDCTHTGRCDGCVIPATGSAVRRPR
jgi:hypothetical protein